MHECLSLWRTKVLCLIPAVALALSPHAARAGALEDALALIPADAGSLVVVPSLASANADCEACIAAMDRKESVLAGRPIDQLRGVLGIKEGLDERGSLAFWSTLPAGAGEPRQFLLLPADEPEAFIRANIAPAADGAGALAGTSVFARALAKHVLVARSKEDLDAYDAKGGIASALVSSIGDRGRELVRHGDVIAWASAAGTAQWRTGVQEQVDGQEVPGLEVFARTVASPQKVWKLLAGCDSTLLVLDFDALGVSLRALASFAQGSQLESLAAGATAPTGQGGSVLAGLPRNPFYLAAALDAQALGGTGKLDALAQAIGAEGALPEWLAKAKEGVTSVRFACYPSKLGILAGGVLNDCALVVASSSPEVVRDQFKAWLLAQQGKSGGVSRAPSWEVGRTLKSGTVVDAFELKTEPLGASEADGADMGDVASQQMFRQVLFGSRGMHGFVKVLPAAVVMTFSQRPDVLDRAVKAVESGPSLDGDPTLVAMRPWLVPGAQAEAFLSVGQVVKLVRQIADAFGGAGAQLPSIPARSPPVAVSLRIGERQCEGALMLPTQTIAAVYDQAKARQVAGDDGAADDDGTVP